MTQAWGGGGFGRAVEICELPPGLPEVWGRMASKKIGFERASKINQKNGGFGGGAPQLRRDSGVNEYFS